MIKTISIIPVNIDHSLEKAITGRQRKASVYGFHRCGHVDYTRRILWPRPIYTTPEYIMA